MHKSNLLETIAKLRSQWSEGCVISYLLHGVAQDSWKSIKCSNGTEKTSKLEVRANC